MSVQKKLTVLFLAVGLLPVVIVSVVAYNTLATQLTTRTVQQIDGIASKQEQRLASLLQAKQEEAVRLAGFQYDLQQALAGYLANGNQQDYNTIISFIGDRRNEIPLIQAIYITKESGAIIATTAASKKNETLSADDIFVEPNHTSTVRLREDPSDHINKLYVTTPLSVSGKEVGRVLIVYRLNDILALVQDYSGLGETGETILAHNQGNVAVSLFPLRFDSDAALSTQLTSLNVQDSGNSVRTDSVDYRQKQVVVATRHVTGTDWLLATKIDIAEALQPITNVRNIILFISGGAFLLIAGIAYIFGRYFTSPIKVLTEKTKGIMLGDFRQRIKVVSNDEIGVLGQTFNHMTDKLAESYEALEQKVLERTKALQATQARLLENVQQDEALLSSIGDGVVATDKTGRILLMNPAAKEMLKLGDTPIAGRFIHELWDTVTERSEPIPLQDQPISLALSTGRTIHTSDYYFERKLGDTKVARFAVADTTAPVLVNGQTIGTMNVFRDITHEKQVDRMKTEFISLASHQLRTPLSAIRWFTEMLVNGDAGKLTAEQQEFAQNISGSTQRMIELVTSLLNISRIESGRIIVDPKPTDIGKLIGDIVNDLKGKTAEKRQNLVVNVHPDLPMVNLDPQLIGQVFLNFLTNAIKYTPQGGEITVMVSRKGEELISQVADNGYGIPKAQQNRVFQKFFRAENITKVEADGTGLGLYLVKSIIESSGGRVWFKSKEGEGTAFWFSLPMSGMAAKAGEVTLDS